MKGIALIRRQIGHLDSVWFLMPNDTVMTLSLVRLSASLAQSLSRTESEEAKEKDKGKRMFLIISSALENEFLITQWRHFRCVCVCVIMCPV